MAKYEFSQNVRIFKTNGGILLLAQVICIMFYLLIRARLQFKSEIDGLCVTMKIKIYSLCNFFCFYFELHIAHYTSTVSSKWVLVLVPVVYYGVAFPVEFQPLQWWLNLENSWIQVSCFDNNFQFHSCAQNLSCQWSSPECTIYNHIKSIYLYIGKWCVHSVHQNLILSLGFCVIRASFCCTGFTLWQLFSNFIAGNPCIPNWMPIMVLVCRLFVTEISTVYTGIAVDCIKNKGIRIKSN